MKKAVKVKQSVELEVDLRKIREEFIEGVLYMCTKCGVYELISNDIVKYFEIISDDNIDGYPSYRCKSCEATMRPKKLDDSEEVTYEF